MSAGSSVSAAAHARGAAGALPAGPGGVSQPGPGGGGRGPASRVPPPRGPRCSGSDGRRSKGGDPKAPAACPLRPVTC